MIRTETEVIAAPAAQPDNVHHSKKRDVLEAQDVLTEEKYLLFVESFQKIGEQLRLYLNNNPDFYTKRRAFIKEKGPIRFLIIQQFSEPIQGLTAAEVVNVLLFGTSNPSRQVENSKLGSASCSKIFEKLVVALVIVMKNRPKRFQIVKPTVKGNKSGEDSELEAVKIAAREAGVLGTTLRPTLEQPYIESFITRLFQYREMIS